MSSVLVPSRRGFLTGLAASLFAAPAIVRAASLMPVKALAEGQLVTRLDVLYGSFHIRPEWALQCDISSINQTTREADRLFTESNEFLQNINSQYDEAFAAPGAKIGTSIRIRLPADFKVRET